MAELVVLRPLDEADLDYDLRTDPVGSEARQPDGFGERWLGDFESVELGAEIEEKLIIKAGADLADEDEIL